MRRRLLLAILCAIVLAPLFIQVRNAGRDEPKVATEQAPVPPQVATPPQPIMPTKHSPEPMLAEPTAPDTAPSALEQLELTAEDAPVDVSAPLLPPPETGVDEPGPARRMAPMPFRDIAALAPPPFLRDTDRVLGPSTRPDGWLPPPVASLPEALPDEAVVPTRRPDAAPMASPVPSGPTEVPAEADPGEPAILPQPDLDKELAAASPEAVAPAVTAPGPRPRLPPDEPPANRPGRGSIALIIDDVGPAEAWSRRALALPGPLTMAFLPYADGLDGMTAAARRAGHEIFLHMPMQPVGDENPGPNALLAGMDEATLRERLTWAIGRVGTAAGVNNHMGSLLTSEPRAMATVMEVLREHRLIFVDSRTTPRSVADGAAESAGIPHVGRDVFLDHFPGTGFVRRQLAEVERRARANGSVVVIGHPLPATLEVLEAWIPSAKARGFRFVPVSKVIATRYCGRRPTAECLDGDLTHVAAKSAVP